MSDITKLSIYLSTKFISSFTFIYFKNLNKIWKFVLNCIRPLSFNLVHRDMSEY